MLSLLPLVVTVAVAGIRSPPICGHSFVAVSFTNLDNSANVLRQIASDHFSPAVLYLSNNFPIGGQHFSINERDRSEVGNRTVDRKKVPLCCLPKDGTIPITTLPIVCRPPQPKAVPPVRAKEDEAVRDRVKFSAQFRDVPTRTSLRKRIRQGSDDVPTQLLSRNSEKGCKPQQSNLFRFHLTRREFIGMKESKPRCFRRRRYHARRVRA